MLTGCRCKLNVWITLSHMMTQSCRFLKMWISINIYVRFIGKFTLKLLGNRAGEYKDRSES